MKIIYRTVNSEALLENSIVTQLYLIFGSKKVHYLVQREAILG
jgi:hypothetical protein